jgi:PAS domain S-box-containing protein
MLSDVEIRSALAGLAERELARRSTSTAIVYFLVIVLVAWTTPYATEYPVILGIFACLTLFAGVGRTVSARRLAALPLDAVPARKGFFILSLYLSFVIWGIFSGVTVLLYPNQWTAMYVLLATAALAAGGSSSLAPDRRLAYRCLMLLILPTTICAVAEIDRRHLAVASGTVVYLVFLLAQVREHARAFWSSSIAAERERLRGSAERVRVEAERASLAAAVEQSAEQILITGIDGSIQYCNPAFQQVTGYSREEVVGRNPRILNSGKHDHAFHRELWETIAAGNVWTGRFTNRKKDRTLYEAEGTISPICDSRGKITGYVAAMHDVTERLRMEADLQQAQRLEGIGRLAGGVAHDFNNLLTVISGYSGLLDSQMRDDENGRIYVDEIKKATDRAAALTRQLLAFGRKQLIRPRPVDLNELLGDMHGILQRLVGEDVDVTIAAAPALGLVQADPDQISQILLNLAANARDAMPNGGKLAIRTGNVSEDESPLGRPSILLGVSDTGVGIAEDVLDHIFEPFFTTKERGRGTGLGLATVYGVVRQSDGCIEVRSERGEGTLFEIYLPRTEASVPATQATPARTSKPAGGSETILVVEDQEEVRRMILASLESCGYRVLEAADGRAALDLASRHEGVIDLLLTDVIMPGMTGKETADRLALFRPNMKVLYISGYSGQVIAHRGVIDDSVAYLQKPFSPFALAAKVREVLG